MFENFAQYFYLFENTQRIFIQYSSSEKCRKKNYLTNIPISNLFQKNERLHANTPIIDHEMALFTRSIESVCYKHTKKRKTKRCCRVVSFAAELIQFIPFTVTKLWYLFIRHICNCTRLENFHWFSL